MVDMFPRLLYTRFTVTLFSSALRWGRKLAIQCPMGETLKQRIDLLNPVGLRTLSMKKPLIDSRFKS